ncbi:MAG: hypothetical protein M1832_002080 [Thelocarpon impressellum]|nr:MAG: hypothetical protein M1832_002080 [Thelocarpon impressellum]
MTYSAFVDVLDNTSCTVPVTQVDKSIDVVNSGYEPVSEVDKATSEICESFETQGATLGLTLRRRAEDINFVSII